MSCEWVVGAVSRWYITQLGKRRGVESTVMFWNCVISNQSETWMNIMIMVQFLSTVVVGNIAIIWL